MTYGCLYLAETPHNATTTPNMAIYDHPNPIECYSMYGRATRDGLLSARLPCPGPSAEVESN